MFHVVEFTNASGGGIGLIREDWLTPRKKECYWPPYKQSSKFNKCLQNGEIPSDDWNLFGIERIFYSTENILKARKKLRDAESESELFTEEEERPVKRRRKVCKRFSFSDDSNDDQDCPSKIVSSLKVPDVPECLKSTSSQPQTSSLFSSSLLDGTIEGLQTVKSADAVLETAKFVNIPIVTVEQNSALNEFSCQNVNESGAIAKQLAKINLRLTKIEQNQAEILLKLSPDVKSVDELSCEVNLPCDSVADVNLVEEWLKIEENAEILVRNLSILGGKKIVDTVKKILERLFTNRVAAEYNWTGKNQKNSLKDLKITKIIPDAVRKNRNTVNATDSEIFEVVTRWFRFCKDRDGGRDARRKKNEDVTKA